MQWGNNWKKFNFSSINSWFVVLDSWINYYSPGIIPTDLIRKLEESDPQVFFRLNIKIRSFTTYFQLQQKFTEIHPMKKLGETEDIASAVLFLASEKAKFITGCILPVDGGLSVSMITMWFENLASRSSTEYYYSVVVNLEIFYSQIYIVKFL